MTDFGSFPAQAFFDEFSLFYGKKQR